MELPHANGLCLLIDDGYTLEGVIAAGRAYPAVKFTYRPATQREVESYFLAGRQAPSQVVETRAKFLATHLCSWDAKDQAGNAVPIREEFLARINPVVAMMLVNFVLSQAPLESDLKN